MATRTPAAHRRLVKEYVDWRKDPIDGVYLKPNPTDICTWNGAFEGPKGTPYEGGVYLLEVKFPKDYPFKMFQITVQTKIHHININDEGKAWLLDPDQWSPALIAKRSIHLLMELVVNPDVNLAMSQATYDEWADNRAAFDEKARNMRDMYASGDIRDWHHLHEDPDWAEQYIVPQQTPSTTSAPATQPMPSFTFHSTPSTTTTTSTTQPIGAPSYEAAHKQLLEAKQRLRSEYEDLLAHPIPCVVAAPNPDNTIHWTGVLDELYGTPYENDLFKFEITFYPGNTAPTLKVTSPIKHPYITTDASIDLQRVLNGYWSSNTTVSDLLRGLVALMKRQS